jgi:excinuclease ABC subunit A
LHFEDVRKLLEVLSRLVDQGNTVIVIEHNLDVIKTADWVIDLGPAGGEGGGAIVVEGTPEQVADCPDSATGQVLRPLLARSKNRRMSPAKTRGKPKAIPKSKVAPPRAVKAVKAS